MRRAESKPSLQRIVEGLEKLDGSMEENRIFLSDSYRKLEGLINKKQYFNLYCPEQGQDFYEGIVKYSQHFKTYMKSNILQPDQGATEIDFNSTLRSTIFQEKYKGSRKCFKVKARIDGQIYQQSKQLKPLYKNSPFNLSLESEPYSSIFYTFTKKGVHPFLSPANEVRQVSDREETTLQPPGIICAIAFEQIQRLQSQLLVIKIEKNQDIRHSRNFMEQGMIRAGNIIDGLLESSSIVFGKHASGNELFNIDRYKDS